MRKIIVGSRQSALALTQTGHVIDDLTRLSEKHGFGFTFEVHKIITKGDRILDVTLSKVGGKGLFVKEIEQAMLDKVIDMAVHSMKDMPSELPEGLINGAVPKRVDPRDCLIATDAASLEELPGGARVGTSSLRRSSQLAALRPDLVIEPVRGNIDSRLKKLENGEYDAILLAAAGLTRMGWQDRVTSYLEPEVCLPAVGQGALGIECREDDSELRKLLALYNDEQTALTVAAERTFLGALNGGCQVPIGAFAVLGAEEAESGAGREGTTAEQSANDEKAAEEASGVLGASTNPAGRVITLTGMVGTPDGSLILKETLTGTDPVQLGEEVARKLIARGAEKILADTRG
ncbi:MULTISPECIES: hydroxymethylbilane synthase [unclassified Paenibacillus]|uniref:hydroxymethylbilane synthase n=1 Tax=unclassified Paenibacillus TaxID=185978 RepID=UPI0024054EAA|nr:MULTISPECIES: hydroxymethylbilane synthase [unclassified Paenibacillus]MDF9844025.1 hydroxymethylbilane synthase [Paenibacillus sp. PastF-2]MDF9850630.1 hydroxymethylbilane synthase [Paenibacillus sp. PastM-2]MDF9857220.1 hydroxymethylbilane synthase [Paenibacillus sp. PastF-1]MDH6482480.1 hydroxymethylbilane synthase [Paenibacillus sp. PastH-2]MDH6509917.1 hydroxymethylbilane synthase [Paenibacillus sp. PastM-3]